MDFVLEQMAVKEASDKEETRYLPPELEGDLLISGLMVSEGVIVPPKPVKVKTVQGPVIESRESNPGVETLTKESDERAKEVVETNVVIEEKGSGNEVTGEKVRNEAEVLVEGEEDVSSVLVEGDNKPSGGCAGVDDLMLDKIGHSVPRTALAQAIAADQTLRVVKGLAKEQKNGYREEDGVILRSRLDDCGNVLQQICLPVNYRQTCLQMAHTKFGHQGRNKMVSLVRPYFY